MHVTLASWFDGLYLGDVHERPMEKISDEREDADDDKQLYEVEKHRNDSVNELECWEELELKLVENLGLEERLEYPIHIEPWKTSELVGQI